MAPKISVIVPVYNAEKTLPNCIEHLLCQHFSDFELILVDNGSTDASLSICRNYAQKDNRIKVLAGVSRGVSNARNAGLQAAQGEWVCFHDADDWADREWLSLFIDNACLKAVFVIQGFKEIIGRSENSSYGFDFQGEPSGAFVRLMQAPMSGTVWNKLFRRDIIAEHSLCFDPDIHFKEDEDFVLKYMLHVKYARSIKRGAYNYVAPDLSTKYLQFDNFRQSLSAFHSVKQLLSHDNTEELPWIRHYLQLLSNAYFHSFDLPQCQDLVERYASYRAEVLNYIDLADLSRFSRFVIRRIGNAACATALFQTKKSVASYILRR